MAEAKKVKQFLCSTEPWVSADITEAEYREWLRSIRNARAVKVGD